MKINLNSPKQIVLNPNFTAKVNPPIIKSLKEFPMDKVDLSTNIGHLLPEKFLLNEKELKALNLLTKIIRLEQNIKVQKQNLRDYYSANDKECYKELLKEKQNLTAQLKRIAKSVKLEFYSFCHYVREKNDYNFFASKIFKATTLEELDKLKDRVLKNRLDKNVEELLLELINYRRTKTGG